MSQPNASYVDGYVTPERRVTVIPEIEYPFENYSVPDIYARLLTEQYDVTPKFFAPKIATRTSWTNYALYNATFANAAWTKTNITNTDNAYPNPDTGASTMASGLETVTNGEHAYQQAYTFTAVAHTVSFIVVPNGRTWFRVKGNDGTTNFTAFFNATGTGTVGTTANCTGTVVLVAAGVYLLSITFTPLAAAGNIYLNYSTDGGTVSYVGNVTLGAYVWGAGIVRASTTGPVIITTSVAVTVSSPNLDPTDIFAYLVWERSPANYNSAVAAVTRRFARVPKEQTAYPGSEYFSLPSVSNDFGGVTSLPVYPQITGLVQINGVGFYNQAASAIFTEYQSSLYGPTKSAGSRIPGYATGGTFTLTFGANTTGSLNWNDSGATIASAINGLASVTAAGLTAIVSNALNTVTGGDLIIQWSVGSTLLPVTMTASLTMSTSSNHPVTSISSSLQQDILMADNVTVTSHGFNTGNSLAGVYATRNVMVVFPTGRWGSIDANTIWVPTAAASGDLSFVGGYNRAYPVGVSVLLRTRELEDYYLPGITLGITTPADIPVPSDLQNPVNFISAALTLTGFQTYKSVGPMPWLGTLIYVLKKIQINMSDF